MEHIWVILTRNNNARTTCSEAYTSYEKCKQAIYKKGEIAQLSPLEEDVYINKDNMECYWIKLVTIVD